MRSTNIFYHKKPTEKKKNVKKSKQIDTAQQYTEQTCTAKFFQINNGLYIIYV